MCPMITAYVDESGTSTLSNDQRYYSVALLYAENPRPIEKLVRRLRRSLHRHTAASELKAAQSNPQVIRRLLTGLAETDCEIYAVIVDKRRMTTDQAEAAYRAAVARVVLACVERHPHLTVYLDKRYTKRTQRLALEQVIRLCIATIPDQVVLIEQVESWSQPGLQAVDFVAWALQQRHAMHNDWAVQLIADRVISEEIVEGIKIAAWPGSR